MERVKIWPSRFWLRVKVLVKWMLLGGISGVVIGIVAGLFGVAISAVTANRVANPWMLYFLPVAGLLIVAVYKFDKYKTNTNLVLEGIHGGKYVPLMMAPLIAISTILTHMCGGSAGREGAALQLGGSLGGTFGKWLHLDESDLRIMIMVGMSAAFSALFGTPLTATIFSIEVASVGIMQYAALVPCAFASFAARDVAEMVGCIGEEFEIPVYDNLTFGDSSKVIILAFCCAGVSILFCWMLHQSEHFFQSKFKNPWLRVVVGSLIVIGMALALNTTDYLGTGMNIIERAVDGEVVPYAFLAKMIFTAVTLGCGFKGGEIVPSLFVGATFGCLFGQVTGLSPSLCAACGTVATFCGMTNCPISSIFLSFELFGFGSMPYLLFAVGVGYLESGYFGLYNSQKLVYSKSKLTPINKHANEKPES